MLEIDQRINASADQVGAGETINQEQTDWSVGVQSIVIGVLYTGPVQIHIHHHSTGGE